jgi:hypothetical protein
MKRKEEITRITVDIPVNMQKKLKAIAAVHSKSMREVITESLANTLKDLEAEIAKCFSDEKE